tara:strand:+ start:5002 stop:5211 length:210 start_codon:yes stop_codon:yes gene_type:complete
MKTKLYPNQTLTVLDYSAGEIHQYNDIDYEKITNSEELDDFITGLGYDLTEVEYMFHTDKTIYNLTNNL